MGGTLTFIVQNAQHVSGSGAAAELARWTARSYLSLYLSQSEMPNESDGTRLGPVLPLIAARRMTREARQFLTERGISWAEGTTGRVHLVGPGLYVHTGPTETDSTAPQPRRHASDAALKPPLRLRGLSARCVETLLLAPAGPSGHGTWGTGELAHAAHVSAGWASRVLQRLRDEGAVTAEGDGPRYRRYRLDNPALALDLWAEEEQFKRVVRTPLYVWSRSHPELLDQLASLQAWGAPWAFGGVAAANLYAPTLTVEPPPEIWIPADRPPAEVARVLQGELVEEGATLFLLQMAEDPWQVHVRRLFDDSKSSAANTGAQGHAPDHVARLCVVSRPRAYIEACGIGTGRAQDVAHQLRRQMHLE